MLSMSLISIHTEADSLCSILLIITYKCIQSKRQTQIIILIINQILNQLQIIAIILKIENKNMLIIARK